MNKKKRYLKKYNFADNMYYYTLKITAKYNIHEKFFNWFSDMADYYEQRLYKIEMKEEENDIND